MLRKLGFAVITLGTIHASPAQAQWVSAPISNISYEITADSSAVGRRQLGVVMSFNVAGTEPVILSLPAWSPGHYVLLWFSRRVSQFTAQSNGAALDWRKLDFQTWEIKPRSAGTVRVSFNYLADAVDRAVAWTAPNFAFFNGTNLFLYPTGRGFDWPARVSVKTEPSWGVATGMDPASGVNSFTAGNYHDLTDMPFYVGRFALDSAQIAGKWIRLAWYPAASLTPARRDRAFGWLQKFVPAHITVFGEAPFRNYTLFQRSDTVVNGGGLEHQSSQVDEVTTSGLDGNLSGLYSHEFFHAWNVKRLRPADLVPYRYDDAQQTTWLWVSEGVTDYYGALGLVRGGVNDSTGFFNFIANEIASVAGAPPTAVSDASFGAWIAPTDGSGGLYYPKGGLTGFLLDIMIRDASNNRRSLDTVMRNLYRTTYKTGRGFTGADWWGAVSRAAGGKSFADFAAKYVDGRDPYPWDRLLPLAGMRTVTDTLREPRLGISTGQDSSGAIVIQRIQPGSVADAAGVKSGDILLGLGNLSVSDQGFGEAFRSRFGKNEGDSLPIKVRRGNETLTLPGKVALIARTESRIVADSAASEKAVRIREGILTGRTE